MRKIFLRNICTPIYKNMLDKVFKFLKIIDRSFFISLRSLLNWPVRLKVNAIISR